MTVFEKAREIPIVWEGDLCVLGGSCTGLFAAVRAARLGCRVCVVERGAYFGGTATAGLVNIWHSLWDFDFREQIIAGLTEEVLRDLERKGQCVTSKSRSSANRFNPIALIRSLDELALREKVKPFFHTFYAGAEACGGRVNHVYVQNKDGRGAIKAAFYIDATGDGDLLRDLGVERRVHPRPQPPTETFLLKGTTSPAVIGWAVREHGAEFGLDDDWGWFGEVPGLEGVSFRADNHVFGFDLSKAEELTAAELEGRRRAFALEALLKKYVSPELAIVNLAASIGIRETAHYATRFQATKESLLLGERYPDAILQGTYCVDVHHAEDNGITFLQLNGESRTHTGKDTKVVCGNWRHEMGLGDDYARFYQIPFRTLVTEDWGNVLPAGRMLNADEVAYGALRVMVNTNQTGEAAGAAAALCLRGALDVRELSGSLVREELRKGGSAL